MDATSLENGYCASESCVQHWSVMLAVFSGHSDHSFYKAQKSDDESNLA